jgi:hypothetical protein
MQDGVCPTCWLRDEAHTSRKLQNTALVGRSVASAKEAASSSASALHSTSSKKATW